MTNNAKQIYLQAIRDRYHQAGKAEKAQILNEYCAVCGYHRKYAIHKINHQWLRHKKVLQKKGPKSSYQNKPIVEALKEIWLAARQPCGKRFKAFLPLWLSSYPGAKNVRSCS